MGGGSRQQHPTKPLTRPFHPARAACVGGTDAADRENCVLRCMSPPCYEETYGSDPLEDGEVDTVRGRKFRVCAKAWLKDEKERKARERAEEM